MLVLAALMMCRHLLESLESRKEATERHGQDVCLAPIRRFNGVTMFTCSLQMKHTNCDPLGRYKSPAFQHQTGSVLVRARESSSIKTTIFPAHLAILTIFNRPATQVPQLGWPTRSGLTIHVRFNKEYNVTNHCHEAPTYTLHSRSPILCSCPSIPCRLQRWRWHQASNLCLCRPHPPRSSRLSDNQPARRYIRPSATCTRRRVGLGDQCVDVPSLDFLLSVCVSRYIHVCDCGRVTRVRQHWARRRHQCLRSARNHARYSVFGKSGEH